MYRIVLMSACFTEPVRTFNPSDPGMRFTKGTQSRATLRSTGAALQQEEQQQMQLRRDWTAAFTSQPAEYSNISLSVSAGALPVGLRGTLFKNGPANFERGGKEYAHWLDGDGYMTALHLSDGLVSWSGRYVATSAYTEEVLGKKVMYRTTFGTQKPGGPLANALDIRLKSPANTNVLALGASGPLLALWEAGPPYELDSESLACRGPSSLGGRLKLSSKHGALPGTTTVPFVDAVLEESGFLTDACSAHPREDDASRSRTIAWSWRQRLVGEPAIEVALHSIPHNDEDGSAPAPAPVRATLEDVPFAPHDMALTENHALFVTSPTRVDILPFILGLAGPAQCTKFDAPAVVGLDSTSRIHVVDRNIPAGEDRGGGEPALAVNIGGPYHPVHHANAWEEESDSEDATGKRKHLHLLSSCWPPAAVRRLACEGSSLLGSWEELLEGDFSKVPMTNLVHYIIDMNTQHVEHTILCEGAQIDHPRVHPRWATRKTRFVFGTLGRHDNGGKEDAVPQPPQSFGCVDVTAAANRGALIDSWHAGARRLVDEATLVPMDSGNGSEDVDERAVWLVAPIFDGVTRKTSYVVLDGRDLASGPVCELALPTFVPWGLHGCWRSDNDKHSS